MQMSRVQDERPNNYYEAYIIEDGAHKEPVFEEKPEEKARKRPVLDAIAQIAIGALLVLIGIPMLILPGPGLLSIAAGVMFVASGVKSIFGPAARAGSSGAL